MPAIQRGQLLTLPPELIWELLYILILDHLHSVFYHEQTWDAVVVLPSICSEIRGVALSIYSNVFNIPQAPDGSLTRNPHPDIEWVANIDRGLSVPLEGVDVAMTIRLYDTIVEKTFVSWDHGLLGVYATAAHLRCSLALAFAYYELLDDPEAVYQLRYGLANSIRHSLLNQLMALKPQRLTFLAGEVLIPEVLETLNILDLTSLTCSIGEMVYHYQHLDDEGRIPQYNPKQVRKFMALLTDALEILDRQDCSTVLPYIPISSQSGKRSMITPRLLNLSEVLYPLYEATQAIPQDEEENGKIHARVKNIYDKWDGILRNDNLARGLPAPDHDQPWNPEEEPVAEQ